jgi:transcriptional regulator with XRE-family HTH domain
LHFVDHEGTLCLDQRTSDAGSIVVSEFGRRLRQERERKDISIDSIAAATKIKASLFEQLERGDASKWPSGIFGRSHLRAYAHAIGLDPDVTVREFLAVFPDPANRPDPTLAGRSNSSEELRLHLAGGAIPTERWRALCCDGAVIGGAGLCAFFLVGALWAPLAIATCMYYVAGTVFTGATPGMFLQTWWRGRLGRRNASQLSSATTQSPAPFPIKPEQTHNLSPELSLR